MEAEIDLGINPLMECCAHLFALVMPLRAGRQSVHLAEDFREQVESGFDVLERMAFERQIATGTVQDAKYAMAAFIDESVMASEWPGRLDWMSRPLQLEYFGEHLAGERFFEKLKHLRQGGEQNLNLLELYYACLQLGFEGIYKMHGLEQLMALQVDLRSQIDGYRGVADPRLSPDGIVKTNVFARVGRNIPYWVIGVVTGAVVFFAYAGYITVTHNATEQALASIGKDRQLIVKHFDLSAQAKEEQQ